jgi:phosphopantothenoylcysteine decarboxylase/phosphopantothenate--cysteine ligase
MAAAPADFRPVTVAEKKIKKGDSGAAPPVIELALADDILATTASSRKPGAIAVGFALETHDLLENSASKLKKKSLDFIVANSAAEEGSGFRVDTNRVSIISRDGSVDELPLMKKSEVAEVILDRIERLLSGR